MRLEPGLGVERVVGGVRTYLGGACWDRHNLSNSSYAGGECVKGAKRQ